MAKIRVSDISKDNLVNDAEPKFINIHIGIEDKEGDHFSADISDDEYDLLKWIISDVENVKAALTSAKRRRAKLGKPKKEKAG